MRSARDNLEEKRTEVLVRTKFLEQRDRPPTESDVIYVSLPSKLSKESRVKGTRTMYTVQLSGLLLKRYHRSYVQTGTRLTPSRYYGNYGKFRECQKKISLWLRDRSGRVAEACIRQVEFIAAQRVRRSMQIFHLHARVWEKVVLKEFIKSWRNRSFRNSKRLLTSTIGVTVFNWDHERISDEQLNR